MMTAPIHEDAIDLIQYFEGCMNVAYACPAHISNGGTWPHLTIGYGHSGPDVRSGMRITTSQARDLLTRDIGNVTAMLHQLVKRPLELHQFGALASLGMNLKPGLLKQSRTLALLNAGDYGAFDLPSAYAADMGHLSGMARQWAEFRNIITDGVLQPLNGLIKRRAAELELFFSGSWSVPPADRLPQLLADPQEEPEMFRPGMRDAQVQDLHEALAAAGFPTTCGDAYTWVTAQAVTAFQRQHGLTADGVYGPATARKLAEILGAR